MSDAFDPLFTWLGIPPAEQPPNYYRLLGIDLYESVPVVIERAADQALLYIATIGRDSPDLDGVLVAIAAAKQCLLDPDRKEAYDARLHATNSHAEALQAVAGIAAQEARQEKARLLGDYVLVERIGTGGMGQVFKAQHRRTREWVAIKVLSPTDTRTPDSVARFYREAEAATRLRHPNIVAAFSSGEQNGIHYLVMEFVDGKDLASLVKKDGPLPFDKVIDYMLQAARGLAFAHSKGIIHRDVKPSNLLVDQQGVLKILDLGLARHEVPMDFEEPAGEASIDNTGPIMGTVDYMSPEQALDTGGVDPRADIYSLGCTMYRLLTGMLPFTGDTFRKKLQAHRLDPIPSLRMLRPDASGELDNIFAQMVAKRPDDRYPTMGLVIEALEACRAEAQRMAHHPQAESPQLTAGPLPLTASQTPVAGMPVATPQPSIASVSERAQPQQADPRWSYNPPPGNVEPPLPVRTVGMKQAPPPPVAAPRTIQSPPAGTPAVSARSSAAPSPLTVASFGEQAFDFRPPPSGIDNSPGVAVRPKPTSNIPVGLWVVAIVAGLVSVGALIAIAAILMNGQH